MTEPGQPWVIRSGMASGFDERAWSRWIRCPPDFGQQLRYRVEPRLGRPPVVAGAPVVEQVREEAALGALPPSDAGDLVRQP